MCRPTTCEVCGKTTWKGCGKHIDSVKEQVPPDQWCDKGLFIIEGVVGV